MLPIIDKNRQKEYALLSLLDSEDRYFSCQELAKNLTISERTVHKYLQSLTVQLENFSADELSIERSTALGIRLHRAPWLNIHTIYAQFAQQSLTYDFFHSIFLETADTSTAFCLAHFVSSASLYRSLSPCVRHFPLFRCLLMPPICSLPVKKCKSAIFIIIFTCKFTVAMNGLFLLSPAS